MDTLYERYSKNNNSWNGKMLQLIHYSFCEFKLEEYTIRINHSWQYFYKFIYEKTEDIRI